MIRTLPLLLSLCCLACGYQPLRFRPGEVVHAVDDRRPIETPRRRRPQRELFVAETHADAHFVAAWRAGPTARARDVNRHDEVVGSSWFCPQGCPPPPPEAPHVAAPRALSAPFDDDLASTFDDGEGGTLVMVVDPPTLRRLRSTALVVGSRLARAVGYRSASFSPVTSPGGGSAAVARWPVDDDLGSTPLLGTRLDDPNDLWDHEDRRSLRAFPVFAAWIGMTRYDPSTLRDVYVGSPGQGHVEHRLLGLQNGLGVGWYRERMEDALDVARDDVGFGGRLYTLGLAPRPDAPELPDTTPGDVLARVPFEMDGLSPPFPPGRRMGRDDAYWMAKRIDAVTKDTVAAAVAAADLPVEQAGALVTLLEARRRTLVKEAYAAVTPLELVTTRPGRWVLRDLAPRDDDGFVAELFDGSGAPLDTPVKVTHVGRRVVLELAAKGPSYRVIRVHRASAPRDRAMELHVDGTGHLLGITH